MTTKTLRLNIDASGAASGAKQFNTAIGNTTKAINKMDAVAGSAFSKLSKEATKTFSTLSRSLGTLSGKQLSGTLVSNISKLSAAMKGFKAPTKTQVSNFKSFVSAIGRLKINGRNFSKLGTLTAAMAGFRAPSKTQTANLVAFVNALNSLNITSRVTKLASDLERVARSATRAALALRRVNKNLGGARAPMRTFSKRAAKSAGAMRGLENAFDGTFQTASLFRGFIGAFTFATFTRNIFEATIAVERFLNLTNAISQSTGLGLNAEAEFKDIARITRQLGGDLRVATEEYGKFSAAALNSGLSLAETKAIYKSLSGATTVLGLSTERTRLSFLAVTQILSKGRVSTEELRRQLGEQIPGLFESFSREVKRLAKTVGVEIDSLDDALRRGLISGEGGALVLEKILREQFGPQVEEALQRADRRLNQLKSTFFEMMVAIGRGGFLDALAESFVRIDETLRSGAFQETATVLGEKLASGVRKATDIMILFLDNLDKVIMGLKIFASIVLVGTFSRFATSMLAIAGPFISMSRVAGKFGSGLLGMSKGFRALSTTVPLVAKGLGIITGGVIIGGMVSLALAMKRGADRTQDFKDGLLEVGKDEFTFGQRMNLVLEDVISNISTAIDKLTELRRLSSEDGAGGILNLAEGSLNVLSTGGFAAVGAAKGTGLLLRRERLRSDLSTATLKGDFELIGQLSLELKKAETELTAFAEQFGGKVGEFWRKGLIDSLGELGAEMDARIKQQISFAGFQKRVAAAREALGAEGTPFPRRKPLVSSTGEPGIGETLTDTQLALRTFGSSEKAIAARASSAAKMLNTLSPLLAVTAKYAEEIKKLDDFQKQATQSQKQGSAVFAEQERRLRNSLRGRKTEAEILKIVTEEQEKFNAALAKEAGLLALSETIESRQRQLQGIAERVAGKAALTQVRDASLAAGEGTFSDAFQQQLDIMRDGASSWAQEVGTIMGGAFNSLTDGIGDAAAQILVMGADSQTVFKQLAQTILSDVIGSLAKIGAQFILNATIARFQSKATATSVQADMVATAAASAPAAAGVSLASFGANAGAAILGIGALIALLGSIGLFAKGGVFNKATAFSHSGGLGVMGEAGPEAVMPLRRDSQGRLGVAAAGGKKSEGNTVNIAIDARGAEQGVEEKIGEVLAEVLPMAIAQASDMAVIRIRNASGRRRI